MNGLVTDLQMFAHKTLQIPLPGRHPPSPILSNGSASPGYGHAHLFLNIFEIVFLIDDNISFPSLITLITLNHQAGLYLPGFGRI